MATGKCYAALASACESSAAAGRRDSALTVMGLSTEGYFDTPIGAMLRALARYADDHERRYGVRIAEHYVIGADWLASLTGLVGLLNGETHRLDCGDVDRAVRDVAEAAGFTRDLEQL